MKMIVILSAFAVFALGAVVGRATVPVPEALRAAAEPFSPSLVAPANPHLPIEGYTAI